MIDTYSQQQLYQQYDCLHGEIADLIRDRGNTTISSVSVSQTYGGLRGVIGVVCDTSEVDPQRGLIIRGLPVADLRGMSAEGLFWLLLGGLPTADQELILRDQLGHRTALPGWFASAMACLPSGTHPMVAMIHALQLLQQRSRFNSAYDSTPKRDRWELALNDALDIIAVLPAIIGTIYPTGRPSVANEIDWVGAPVDWSTRLGLHLGFLTPPLTLATHGELVELLRLYTLAHCDHDGSNACALACHVAGSAHADPYLAVTAGWRALAGPIHGLAAQTCIEFIDAILGELGDAPGADAVAALCQQRLDAGQVIPGFGHAVLRGRDPRYEMLAQFARERFPDDPHFRIAELLGQVVPPLLMATGKVASPWPNVDGITGAVLRHYGLTDYRYLTVLFACAMSLGLLAQYVINRALGTPIMHPRGISMAELKRRVDM